MKEQERTIHTKTQDANVTLTQEQRTHEHAQKTHTHTHDTHTIHTHTHIIHTHIHDTHIYIHTIHPHLSIIHFFQPPRLLLIFYTDFFLLK